MRRVLGQPPVTRLAVPELTLDHPKRMLHLGADAGLELFNSISQGVAGFGLVEHLPLARHHGDLPVQGVTGYALHSISLATTKKRRP